MAVAAVDKGPAVGAVAREGAAVRGPVEVGRVAVVPGRLEAHDAGVPHELVGGCHLGAVGLALLDLGSGRVGGGSGHDAVGHEASAEDGGELHFFGGCGKGEVRMMRM